MVLERGNGEDLILDNDCSIDVYFGRYVGDD